MNVKLLGVDYGDERTGISYSDPTGTFAFGHSTIIAHGKKNVIEKINKICTELKIEKIIVGNPINMNGTIGERSIHVKNFATLLHDTLKIDVELFDERCTTMVAHSIMNFTDTKSHNRKKNIDMLSAQIILQNYIDCKKSTD